MNYDLSKRTIGLNLSADGAEFIVWAPLAHQVELIRNDSLTMGCTKTGRGYWYLKTREVSQGDPYKVKINGHKAYPDPASLSQPDGVHGASVALDLKSFEWHDQSWKGLDEVPVYYEIHPGTFSGEGNFEGISRKIEYFKELGINTLEIMPVAQFPGSANWGYDGVYPFAVQHSYGGAFSLMDLVDKCHNNGIAVLLDVVYNHLGPEGNYLNEFGPYFTDRYKTPWGSAINFDGQWSDGVRHYYTENMLMWLRDFHIDGLRLDAVHAIKDMGPKHIIRYLREQADRLESMTGRKYTLTGEIDLNDTKYIAPYETGGFNLDKQWCDEFHHALHALLTGEKNGYYSDFGEIEQLIKSFSDGYVFDGVWSEHRKRVFGSSTSGIAGDKFIVFTQNHDHIGNRMMGDRLGHLVDFEKVKLAAGAMFISPFVPLVFMGEEYNDPAPFLYFISHTDKELSRAVTEGRRNEFPDFIYSEEFPEPDSPEVFRNSRLTFDISGNRLHMFNFYKELIRMKKYHPVWKSYDRNGINISLAGRKGILLEKRAGDHHLTAIMNFDSEDLILNLPWLNSSAILINSADKKWGGNAGSVSRDDISDIRINGSSILVFSDITSF